MGTSALQLLSLEQTMTIPAKEDVSAFIDVRRLHSDFGLAGGTD